MKKEGTYQIKIVDRLPKKGNANFLYTIRGEEFKVFYEIQEGSNFKKIDLESWASKKTIDASELTEGIIPDARIQESAVTQYADALSTTGWAQYADTQYTSASPLSVNSDINNYTALPNDAGNTLDIQKPIDVTTFYDPITQKITGREGDGISVAIEFSATPSANNGWIELAVDIGTGGDPILIYPDTISFPRGLGVTRKIIYKLNSAYTLDTWEANGGSVKFISNVDLTIHSIRYVITRTHKAR